MEVVPKQETSQKQLMEAFKFNLDDLSSNRNGNLGINQKKRILNQGILSFSIFGLVGFLFAGIFIFSTKRPINEIPLEIPGFMIIAFGVIGIALSWLYWRTYRLGTVKQLNGKVFFQQINGRPCLCVSETAIPIIMNVAGLFEEDHMYNIYYAPLISVIVAVEKIS